MAKNESKTETQNEVQNEMQTTDAEALNMANTAADVIATTKQCTPIVPTLGTQVAVVAGENRTVRKPDGTGYFVEDLPNVVIVCTRVHRLIGDGDLVVVQ